MKEKKTWEDSRSLRGEYLKEVVKPLLPNTKFTYTLQDGNFDITI